MKQHMKATHWLITETEHFSEHIDFSTAQLLYLRNIFAPPTCSTTSHCVINVNTILFAFSIGQKEKHIYM